MNQSLGQANSVFEASMLMPAEDENLSQADYCQNKKEIEQDDVHGF